MNGILKEFGMRNLRSIYMQNRIRLAPINVLIGKNSAGKSTFARAFPLIRQSCEAKKRAPVLWYGDRIDFGSFSEALQRESTSQDIQFSFSLIADTGAPSKVNTPSSTPMSSEFEARVSFSIKGGQSRSYTSFIEIDALGFKLIVRCNKANNVELIQCDETIWKPNVTDYTDAAYQAVLPRLTLFRDKGSKAEAIEYEEYSPFSDEIFNELQQADIPSPERIVAALAVMPLFEKGTLLQKVGPRIAYIARELTASGQRKLFDFLATNESLIFTFKVNDVLMAADRALRTYFESVRYIEPLRATAQRYYRKQELGIDEIDSKGGNVAMYLDSLPPWQQDTLNAWISENFGFTVKTVGSGGHLAIVICEDGRPETNLADIGFGFSQLLPIIVQVWSSMHGPRKNRGTSCIVIEQPELHLHPALQAKLADVFSAVPADGSGTQLLIETHSSHLINRFGQLISEGTLGNEDVQILIFERDPDGKTSISRSGYDKDGYLMDWPSGFFEPEL